MQQDTVKLHSRLKQAILVLATSRWAATWPTCRRVTPPPCAFSSPSCSAWGATPAARLASTLHTQTLLALALGLLVGRRGLMRHKGARAGVKGEARAQSCASYCLAFYRCGMQWVNVSPGVMVSSSVVKTHASCKLRDVLHLPDLMPRP